MARHSYPFLISALVFALVFSSAAQAAHAMEKAAPPAFQVIVHGSCQTVGKNCSTVTGGLNENNYFDATGAYGAYYDSTMTPSQGWTSSGNINMLTGATITPP